MMDKRDAAAFMGELEMVMAGSAKPRPLTRMQLRAFWRACSHLTIDEFKEACARYSRGNRFFPSVAELLDYAPRDEPKLPEYEEASPETKAKFHAMLAGLVKQFSVSRQDEEE